MPAPITEVNFRLCNGCAGGVRQADVSLQGAYEKTASDSREAPQPNVRECKAMIDFTTKTDLEIIEFVDQNRDLFGGELSEDFPKSLYKKHAAGQLLYIKKVEGFAIWNKGLLPQYFFSGRFAELDFIHVQPAYGGQGIGRGIVREVQDQLDPRQTLELTCKGVERKRLFESCGFEVAGYEEAVDLYGMTWKSDKAEVAGAVINEVHG